MILDADGADSKYISFMEMARRSILPSHDKDYPVQTSIIIPSDVSFYDNPDVLFTIARQAAMFERDEVYRAVCTLHGQWLTLRCQNTTYSIPEMLWGGLEFRVKVEAREGDQKVYVPVWNDMPRDVYACKFCGGYTKNDKRGNCGACGAPRSSDAWIPEEWRR